MINAYVSPLVHQYDHYHFAKVHQPIVAQVL
jgi:hypothetical protein